MYAVLYKDGNLLSEDLTYSEALKCASWSDELQIVDQDHATKLSVWYTEMGGPWGYGHKEPSFITYGPLKTCIVRLYKWMQEESRIWGPDWREVRDFFARCSLTINGMDKTNWMLEQADSINSKMIFI